MSSDAPVQQSPQQTSILYKIGVFVLTAGLVYLLILSVGMVGTGFKWSAGGKEGAKEIFKFATNPFMGLILGIFATALVQSSSTVTSVIVGLVAGGLPVHAAVPMIMGANIGTTVTNTFVSLGHITKPAEFQRAFAAATVHDLFNFLAVAIFLSIEIIVSVFSPSGQGLLEMFTEPIAATFAGSADVGIKDYNFIKPLTKPIIGLFHHKSGSGMLDGMGALGGGITMILIALVFIFTSILSLGKVLKKNLTGKAERVFHAAVGRGPVSGIISGSIVTVLVQSSSTTTSLIIPMAGSGVMKLQQIFPFTLGANIGTTVTAMIASLAGGDSPELARAALQIALVHLSFNLFATVLIYSIPFLRNIPLRGAEWLADVAVKKRVLALTYIAILYFVIPLCLLLFMQAISSDETPSTPGNSDQINQEQTPATQGNK